MPRAKTVLPVANGDLRQSANQVCWPAQVAMEKKLAAAVAARSDQSKNGRSVRLSSSCFACKAW